MRVNSGILEQEWILLKKVGKWVGTDVKVGKWVLMFQLVSTYFLFNM